MPADIHLTTPIVWTCAGIVAGVDIFLGLIAQRALSREQFNRLRRLLILSAGIFYLLVWSSAMRWAWDWFYVYIFPSWARLALPPIFFMGYALLAWGMTWLSLRLPGSPAVNWCVLGGVEGLLSHLLAIYGLGAATKPPIMLGTDPLVVLIFAIFEKAFYWSLILLACGFLSARINRRAEEKPLPKKI